MNYGIKIKNPYTQGEYLYPKIYTNRDEAERAAVSIPQSVSRINEIEMMKSAWRPLSNFCTNEKP